MSNGFWMCPYKFPEPETEDRHYSICLLVQEKTPGFISKSRAPLFSNCNPLLSYRKAEEAIQASDSISIQINYEAYADILQNTSTEMNSAKTQSEIKSSSSPAPPAPTSGSCRKKKSEGASFIADVRDHIDEFINASMDEHKTCFKKSMQKMFGMSKIVAERSSEMKEVESSLPLKTTVSEQ